MTTLGEKETEKKPHKINKRRQFWKEEEEKLLKDWADKAQCYHWMHLKAHKKFKKKNIWFTIPVIILSTITGTANFAQDRFGEDYKNSVIMSIGTLNIITGIITTIAQYLKISELNESHRVSSLSWGKFYRNIKTELAKNPLDRTSPLDMLKISKEEYDRLIEISPVIPKKVLKKFKTFFKKIEGITTPDICGTMEPTEIYPLTIEERKELQKEYLNMNGINRMNELKTKSVEEIKEKKKESTIIYNRVEKFKNTFFELNRRYPSSDEIERKLNMLFEEQIDNINNNIDDSNDIENISNIENSSSNIELEIIENNSNSKCSEV